MNTPVTITKLSEVTQVSFLVEASQRDDFTGEKTFAASLPATFPYGAMRTMRHSCSQCQCEVEVAFTYGRQLLASSRLSRQGFQENKQWLDAVGTLFGQYLHHKTDVNGFETYLYLTEPDNARGALLSVGYYRCPHCSAQYLLTYQVQLKEERPPFEPDELYIRQLFQVALDHTAFLSVVNPQALSPQAEQH